MPHEICILHVLSSCLLLITDTINNSAEFAEISDRISASSRSGNEKLLLLCSHSHDDVPPPPPPPGASMDAVRGAVRPSIFFKVTG